MTSSFFGPVIYAYTRADALRDGELVDVSAMAAEMGYRVPVTVTRAVWVGVVEPDETPGQSVEGRLWDVLWMLHYAIKTERRSGSVIRFQLYALIGGPELSGWAAEKYRYNPVWGTILRMGSGIFIQRGQVDRDALAGAIAWLKQGKVFGIAPEGTRSKTGGLARGKSGVAYLAQQSGAPILPMAHFGTEKVLRTWLRLRRPEVIVRMGPLFTLPPLPAGDRSAGLRQQADLVMCHIGALLPPEYRGVYADHPQLRRLLAVSGNP